MEPGAQHQVQRKRCLMMCAAPTVQVTLAQSCSVHTLCAHSFGQSASQTFVRVLVTTLASCTLGFAATSCTAQQYRHCHQAESSVGYSVALHTHLNPGSNPRSALLSNEHLEGLSLCCPLPGSAGHILSQWAISQSTCYCCLQMRPRLCVMS